MIELCHIQLGLGKKYGGSFICVYMKIIMCWHIHIFCEDTVE